MKVFPLFILWRVIFILFWPVAVAAAILAPVIWLLAIPFRVVGICVDSALAFPKEALFLPARILGHRG